MSPLLKTCGHIGHLSWYVQVYFAQQLGKTGDTKTLKFSIPHLWRLRTFPSKNLQPMAYLETGLAQNYQGHSPEPVLAKCPWRWPCSHLSAIQDPDEALQGLGLWLSRLNHRAHFCHCISDESAALLLVQLPANVPCKAAEDDPRAWAPVLYMGNLDESPALAFVATGGSFSAYLSLCLSLCLLKKQKSGSITVA